MFEEAVGRSLLLVKSVLFLSRPQIFSFVSFMAAGNIFLHLPFHPTIFYFKWRPEFPFHFFLEFRSLVFISSRKRLVGWWGRWERIYHEIPVEMTIDWYFSVFIKIVNFYFNFMMVLSLPAAVISLILMSLFLIAAEWKQNAVNHLFL